MYLVVFKMLAAYEFTTVTYEHFIRFVIHFLCSISLLLLMSSASREQQLQKSSYRPKQTKNGTKVLMVSSLAHTT